MQSATSSEAIDRQTKGILGKDGGQINYTKIGVKILSIGGQGMWT